MMPIKKIVNTINSALILLCLLTIVMILVECDFLAQKVFMVAFLSTMLLIVNAFLIKKTLVEKKKEAFNHKVRQEEKEEVVEVSEDEKNTYLTLISAIDSQLPWPEILNIKFQKLAETIQLVAGMAYFIDHKKLKLSAVYAVSTHDKQKEVKVGEGLLGQVAKDGLPIIIDLDEKIDIEIISGLGQSKPKFLCILPLLKKNKIIGVVELATFSKLSEKRINFLIEAFGK